MLLFPQFSLVRIKETMYLSKNLLSKFCASKLKKKMAMLYYKIFHLENRG